MKKIMADLHTSQMVAGLFPGLRRYCYLHRKPGAHCCVGCVRMRLSKIGQPTQPSCILCNGTGHIPPFSTSKGICFSRKYFPIASAVRVSYVPALSSEIIFSILTWTYRVLDKPKVIIMGNSYGVLAYGVLKTLLFGGPLSKFNAKSHVQADEPPQCSPKFR